MSDLSRRLAQLSPEKQKLLVQALHAQADTSTIFPLSFAQQRLWFLDQWTPGESVYHLPCVLRMAGCLDVAALAHSMRALIQRHESLRTIFVTVADQPFQLIQPTQDLALTLLDLRELPTAARLTLVPQLARVETQRPFDLAHGPLLRATLLCLAEQQHVLLLTMHHIIADGWSLGVLWRDLAALYLADKDGSAAVLPELPIQYADYALWQQAHMHGAQHDELLDYWLRQLAGAPPLLALPTDRPRSTTPRSDGARAVLSIPQALTDALMGLSRREGTTLFMTLLTAFATLLYRYSGQADIVVGAPIAGRTLADIDNLIGCFINTLALRIGLTGEPSFRELLGRVRAVCLDAYAHQSLPFEQLVEALQPERALSHTPLFQVMFVLQNTPLPSLKLPGLDVVIEEGERAAAKFDLSLDLTEMADGLRGAFEYRTELFDAATIARLTRHFQAILATVAADPAQRIGQLQLLSAPEWQALVVTPNLTQAVYSDDACLHELVAAQAARTPDAIALVFDFSLQPSAFSLQLTYRELNARVNQLAQHLRTLGVGPDVRVGLCLERSIDLIVGLLATLTAGGAYVPLDPAYPPERLAFMLEDSQATVVLTDQSIYDLRLTIDDLGESGTPIVNRKSKIVNLVADWPLIARQPASAPISRVTPDNLAYIIYTSGSTGRPKGVLIQHRGVINAVQAAQTYFGVDHASRILQLASTSFDASVLEIGMSLLSGASLHLVPPDAVGLPDAIAELMQTRAITTAVLTPTFLDALPTAAYPALRAVSSGGERCEAATLARWAAGRRFLNAYAPTEATIYATRWEAPDVPPNAPPPLGRPIANMQLYLLDQQMQPVPIGVIGEIYLGGVGLARGYHNRPELTAERFVPNPFADCRLQIADCRLGSADPIQNPKSKIQNGERLYATGDLARYQPDGALEFLGRADDQVKLHGLRIELGEIAAALLLHPAVRDAVVLAREDGVGDRRLVAYVVQGSGFRVQGSVDASVEYPTSDPRPLIPDLRAFLHQRLPDYMLPSAFVLLDALPQLAGGKVDRAALPAPDTRAAQAQHYVPPRTAAEARVAQIWADVLRLERVGVYDNFFVLGGHSLLAAQVISRLSASMGVALPLRSLFEAPTIAALAERIAPLVTDGRAETGSERGAMDISDVLADLGFSAEKRRLMDYLLQEEQVATLQPQLIAPRRGDEAPVLSYAQQRLWLLDQFEPSSASYAIPIAVRLSGALDVAALWQSLVAIAQRHEVLRTTFIAVDGEPMQVIAATPMLAMPIIDVQGVPANERERQAQQLATAEARAPFDLARGPLLRTTLLRLGPQEHILLLNMHHIIADGWSAGVLIREVSTYYAGYATGQRVQLPELPVQYADYAIWQRTWLHSAVADQPSPFETQRAYWHTQLGGRLPLLNLPTDHPRPPVQSFRGTQQNFAFGQPLAASLNALSQQENVTMFMTLLAAFATLLYRHTGQDDVIVGSPIAGRVRPEIEGLIGFFVNMLVLRSDLSGNPSFRELLGRVCAVCLSAYAHQDLPFDQLVEDLLPRRDRSRSPLFTVAFVLQNAPLPELKLPGLTLQTMDIPSGTAKYDLTMNIMSTSSDIRGALEYNTDLFDAPTIMRMLEHFQNLLAGIAADPDQRLASLPLLSEAEWSLLEEWSVA